MAMLTAQGVAGNPITRPSNPYQPVGDYLSNVNRFKIIESTLRGWSSARGVSYAR